MKKKLIYKESDNETDNTLPVWKYVRYEYDKGIYREYNRYREIMFLI